MLTPDSSFAQVEASSRVGAVLPIGALEQHGRHLSLGTDTVTAAYLSQKIAEAFDYFLLPALPYGTSREHLDFPGTVTLSADTLANVVRDIAKSLRYQKFKTLIIVSGHGGNWILKPTVREINLNNPEGPKVILVDPEVFFYPIIDRPGFHHAGDYETAFMLHLRPQSVQKEFIKGSKNEPAMPRTILDIVPLRKVLPTGIWGDPELATVELGKKWLDRAVQVSIDYIRTTIQCIQDAKQNP